MENAGRPRSNAFSGYDMFEQQTGMSKTEVDAFRVQSKRLKLANKAMDYARETIPAPANVMRDTLQAEDARFDEFHNTQLTRAFVSQKIVPGVKESVKDKHDLSYNFGAIAATSSIRREGSCMESSSLVLDYLAGKTKKYQDKLNNPQTSEEDRQKYQFKMQAVGSVNLMEGKSPTGPNHMWVRLGNTDDAHSVSADAWGKGKAVSSDQFRGNQLFTEERKASSFTPQMMMDLKDVKNNISEREHIRKYTAGLKHNKIPTGSSAPSMEQHNNRID